MTETLDPVTTPACPDEAPPPVTHFELRVDEDAGDGLRRIVVEQVDLAIWHARRVGGADEHVHGLRRAAKRVRAVLRMLRDALGDESYRQGNALIRDVAGELSAVRSATVRIATLESLIEWRAPLAVSAVELQGALVADAARMRAAVPTEPALIDDLVGSLQRARSSSSAWNLPSAIVPTSSGLGRTYRRGRLSMSQAYADASTHRFHEWRKRVKYLRHQMEILNAVRPETMVPLTANIEELGDGLGTDHDLADLASSIGEAHLVSTSPAEQGGLLDAIADRRRELRDDLRQLGARIYAQTPQDFVRELTTYWEEWRRAVPPASGR